MIEYFPSKQLRYDISVLMDSRWQIVGAIEDGRKNPRDNFGEEEFNKLATDVQLRARQILAAPNVQGVKVVLEAIRESGTKISREVLSLEAAKAGGAERNVRHVSGDVPACESVDDFLQRPTLYTLGVILRPLLDRSSMTPLELVTVKAISRSVQKNQQAFYEAIAVASRQQAAAMKVTQRARMDALDKLVEKGYQRLRVAETVRDAPVLKQGKGSFQRFMAEIDRRFAPPERRFWYLRGLSMLTDGANSYPGKLEYLLSLDLDGIEGESALELLDEAIAGILDQPDTMRDLLGHQIDMASAILALRDFAQGVTPKSQPELTGPLGLALAKGKLPKAAGAIWDRLVRSLATHQPLTKQGPKEEFVAVTKLQSDLGAFTPPAYQEAVAQAIKKRQADARQRLLERR